MRSATKRFEKKPNVKNMGEKWRRPKYDMSKNRPRYPKWQAEKLVIKFSSSYYTYNKSQKKMKIMSKVDCWQNQSLNLALVEKVEYCISMRARKNWIFQTILVENALSYMNPFFTVCIPFISKCFQILLTSTWKKIWHKIPFKALI